MNRRHFFKEMGKWSLSVLIAEVAYNSVYAQNSEEEFKSTGFSRPSIPNACLEPVTDVEKTLAAVIDTVVPGADTDPNGDPGALESCAMNLLMDDFYPFKAYADLIASIMDQLGQEKFSQKFIDLSYEKRLTILIESQKTLPILRFAYRIIRSAFYGGAYNGIGLTYVDYPGPNLGYRHIKEASFRKPMCQELSDTGWMP